MPPERGFDSTTTYVYATSSTYVVGERHAHKTDTFVVYIGVVRFAIRTLKWIGFAQLQLDSCCCSRLFTEHCIKQLLVRFSTPERAKVSLRSPQVDISNCWPNVWPRLRVRCTQRGARSQHVRCSSATINEQIRIGPLELFSPTVCLFGRSQRRRRR